MDICNDHGIQFIGPRPEQIRLMGDKATARDTMKDAGVPTVPGSDGLITSNDEAMEVAAKASAAARALPAAVGCASGGGPRALQSCRPLPSGSRL